MRGKLQPGQLRGGLPRNIPAYAGKTAVYKIVEGEFEEHPRVCGENISLRYTARGVRGTSPRMRGKRSTILGLVLGIRNIPAYAGKT